VQVYAAGLTVAAPGWSAAVLPPLIQAFAGSLSGMAEANAFVPVLSAALATLAGGIATAQATVPGVVSTPPALQLSASLVLSNVLDAAQAASTLATAIDTWCRTGVVSTGGPTSPWA